jgi:hypothetical protein
VELQDFDSCMNITWVIKLRKMGWAGNVARVGEKCIQNFSGVT